jgi:hypothetical protein
MDESQFDSRKISDIFLLQNFHTVSGITQPPMQWALWDIAPGARQLRREADLSFSLNANIKNA